MEKITITNEMVEKLKRQGIKVADIAVTSAMNTIANNNSLKVSVGVGLMQGLKYRGNFKRGVKAGVTTMGVLVGIDVVTNVAGNWELIKKQ